MTTQPDSSAALVAVARVVAGAHRADEVGIAPGSAFGRGGERFMRLCFAGDPQEIEVALGRLKVWLAGRRS